MVSKHMTTRLLRRNITRKTTVIAIVAVALLGTVALATTLGQVTANNKTPAVAFHDQMRKLWEDHITWTRLVIISIANGLPDTDSTVNRLLQNQADIGNAIKPFYGSAAGTQLTSLLHDHITIAAEILQDAKSGDNTALNDAITRWYANANSIAAFLSSANPKNWPLGMMQAMMKSHLDLTLAEAVAYLHGDYAGSVNGYEQVHLEILGMADTLSAGIVAQFPHDFTGRGSI
jgi:hypothetical protein